MEKCGFSNSKKKWLEDEVILVNVKDLDYGESIKNITSQIEKSIDASQK